MFRNFSEFVLVFYGKWGGEGGAAPQPPFQAVILKVWKSIKISDSLKVRENLKVFKIISKFDILAFKNQDFLA